MKEEYEVNVTRECKTVVTDVYTIYAENKEEAKEKAKELVEDPELLVVIPHDTIEDPENDYSEEFYVTYNVKGSKTRIPLDPLD